MFSIDRIIDAMKTDKKVADGAISLVVVPQAGSTVFIKQSFNDAFTTTVHEILAN